jgi:carbon monoxide dehydrogenase subunit G
VIVEERFAIKAPAERVWQLFLDVPRAAACMPGVEQVEPIDERHYRGKLQVRVGPLKASFLMEVTIEEMRPSELIRMSARGADRATSNLVEARATVRVQPATKGSVVELAIDTAIRGPLGRFGQVVIRDTVRKLTEQFLACVERELPPLPPAPSPTWGEGEMPSPPR